MMSYDNLYRTLKEDFVSNLTGSSVTEIATVTAILTSSVFFWSVLQSRLKLFTPYSFQAFLLDLLIHCGAPLASLTVYSSKISYLHCALLLPTVSLYLLVSSPSRHRNPNVPAERLNASVNSTAGRADPVIQLQPKHFLTMYRGSMMAITCISILAVDFRIFPRRFAKVETWGTSVMDLGVGSFVFAAGVVAARPVLLKSLAKAGGPRAASTFESVNGSILHALPLLILGFVRLLSVKGLDYAEHVTEYGVHWNFFFTLALLGPSVALVDVLIGVGFQPPSVFRPALVSASALVSILASVAYECALNFTSLKAFIIAAPRDNLFSMNREGVFSFVGYLAIFLAGRDVGLAVLPRAPSHAQYTQFSTTAGIKRWWEQNIVCTDIGQLLFKSLFWSILYFISTTRFSFIAGPSLQVSRRLANLPYVFWVAAYNCFQILFCAVIERACFYRTGLYDGTAISKPPVASSELLSAFNLNGLAIFLLANLLTGIVNLTFPTLDMGPLASMGLLGGYITVLACTAIELSRRNIRLKM